MNSSGEPRSEGLVGGVMLVNVATLAWATNMVLGRWLRDDIGPVALAAARFLIASICFWILLRRQPPEEQRLGQDRWWLIGMSLTGVVIFGPTLYLGLHYSTAINATLLNATGPLVTGLMASLFIHEPMSRRQVVAGLVGLVGVAVLISGGSLDFLDAIQTGTGNLIVLAAVLLWSLYSVMARRVMNGRSALSATALSAFIGLPFLLLASIWDLRSSPVDLSWRLLLAIGYIGLVPTVIGFLSWNAGVRRLGAGGAMVFYNTLPVYGALLGYLALGEPIGVYHLVGGALIIAAALWAARGLSAT